MSNSAITWAQRVEAGSCAKKAILICLADHANELGHTHVGQARISFETEVSIRTVKRAMVDWEAEGKIRRVMRFRGDGARTTDDIEIVYDAWKIRALPHEVIPGPADALSAHQGPGDMVSPGGRSPGGIDDRDQVTWCPSPGDMVSPKPSMNPQREPIPAGGGTGYARGTPNSRSPSPSEQPKPNDNRAPRVEDLNPTPSSAVAVAETWTDRAGVRIRGVPKGWSLPLVMADIAADVGCEIHELGAAIDWAFSASDSSWYPKRLVNVRGLRELAPELVVAYRQASRNGRDANGLSPDTRAYLDRIGLDAVIWRKLERREPLSADEQAALEAADRREKALARS